MLKDYFDSTLSVHSQQRINRILDTIPSQCVFASYGEARAFRAMSCARNEFGRYDDFIFLYDGFYYLVSREQRRLIKNQIVRVRRDEDFDLRMAAFDDYVRVSLARDGVKPNK